MGERGSVRELCDLGESTFDGSTLRETPRSTRVDGPDGPVAAAVLVRFLGSGRSSFIDTFSLSEIPLLRRLMPRVALTSLGGCGACRAGEARCEAGASTGIGAMSSPPLGASACSSYLFMSSRMFVFRSGCGIRFTRISSRDRRPCAWRAYCARSLRARSVTVALVRHAFSSQERASSRSGWGSSQGNVLSSCKLSISACFCAAVIIATCRDGLRSGVVMTSAMAYECVANLVHEWFL